MRIVKALLAAVVAGAAALGAEELYVYTYDSFVSWGPAARIEEAFEAAHPGVDLIWVAPGGSSETLSRMIAEIEAGGTDADVFMGISDADLVRASAYLEPYDPGLVPNIAHIPAELLGIEPRGMALPFDQGYVAFVYDSTALPEKLVPRSFGDLLRCELRGKIIVQDPRTSSTGRALLLWTIWRFGERGWVDFWRALLRNVLVVTKGWSEAYDMFLAGEAPIVLSFTTDTAYSWIEHRSLRYRVTLFDGEAYRFVEWMGIVRGSDQRELAHEFMDLVLSRDVQEMIPTTQWMFPVSEAAELPPDFAEHAVIPETPAWLPPVEVGEELEGWISTWQRLLIRG
ncbi:MAG: thiamine ABC transporter substrate-binding protein [Caldiserica bacterium]|nr:thiamine ABC transporter substrate-binding protein [Caldisericota bacterium]